MNNIRIVRNLIQQGLDPENPETILTYYKESRSPVKDDVGYWLFIAHLVHLLEITRNSERDYILKMIETIGVHYSLLYPDLLNAEF